MGIHSRYGLQHTLATPDTPPPESASPGLSSSAKFSDRPGWTTNAPISPPMSNYDPGTQPDMSTTRGHEEGHSRQDGAQSGLRQQLPSISSIFGPPSQMKPLYSPMSDRPSPLTARSPPDHRHSASSNPDRAYPNSYFPRMSPPLAQQSRPVFEPRFDGERQSLSHSASHYPVPMSPRGSRELETVSQHSRHESVSSSRWSQSSSQPDGRRSEYMLVANQPASSFRPMNERLPYPPLEQKSAFDSMAGARDQRQFHSGYQAQTSPSSRVTPEGLPVTGKDGLGPKIWTGTHFLPRFVRQAEVPGEGLCYFYDDGSHCKTIIDGEHVNAHWGVTKAGKPRKRLAIACLTCREKKIKCDPDFPRCVQCDKFGRVCKFKNAPRGGHNVSPVTSPAEQDEGRQLGHPSQAEELNRPRSSSSASVSPRTTSLKRASPVEAPELPPKKARHAYEDYPPVSHSLPPLHHPPPIQTAGLWNREQVPRPYESGHHRIWQHDSRAHGAP